jgi:Flp pilus assembly protein TadG
MRKHKIPIVNRLIKDERGQTAAIILIAIFALLALSAAGIETGHVYYAYRLLQASTNASALAAGQIMPDIGSTSDSMTAGSAYGTAKAYSSIPGGYNVSNFLTETASDLTVTFSCSTAVSSGLNLGCLTNTGSGTACTGTSSTSGCNVVQVKQQATVNLWFAGLVGMHTMSLTAVSTAAMRGGADQAYNIAVIIDTTKSMADDQAPTADDCPSGDSQEQCAVYGLEQMLEMMDPCAQGETCTTSTNYVDDVALFVFPPVSASDQGTDDFSADDYCSRSGPTAVPYGFPSVTGTGSGTTTPTSTNLLLPGSGYSSNDGYYELIGFNNSYKTSDGVTTLNTTTTPGEYLAQAVAYSGTGCNGLVAEGGQGTYYAQAIYAAQAALATMGSGNPGSKNAMIILSDGDATAASEQGNYHSLSYPPSSDSGASELVALNNTSNTNCSTTPCLNGTCPTSSTCSSNPNANSYQYPSALGMCWQAVQAAQWATSQGTTVYTIAMGSETGAPGAGVDGSGASNGSCETDQITETTLTSSTGGLTYPSSAYSGKAGSACNAIGAMASNADGFFSDEGSSPACTATGGNANFTSIPAIFKAIWSQFTTSRLIPNSY